MIERGEQLSREVEIDASRTVDFMGPDMRVYGTPSMVADVELVCRDLLLSTLKPGQDSVGVWASIDHLAPALIGDRIAIHATVKILDGRRVTFDTTIMRAEKIIGLMQHTRTVVSVADLQTRLKQL